MASNKTACEECIGKEEANRQSRYWCADAICQNCGKYLLWTKDNCPLHKENDNED